MHESAYKEFFFRTTICMSGTWNVNDVICRYAVVVENECATGMHDCDQNANCIDTDDGYICTCKDGYIDESPDQSRKPGRVCRPRMYWVITDVRINILTWKFVSLPNLNQSVIFEKVKKNKLAQLAFFLKKKFCRGGWMFAGYTWLLSTCRLH